MNEVNLPLFLSIMALNLSATPYNNGVVKIILPCNLYSLASPCKTLTLKEKTEAYEDSC